MKSLKNQTEKTKRKELKTHLLTKFSQVLKGLGFGAHLFEKKLKKSTSKLAKSITKKKSKEIPAPQPVKKQVLIKPARLKKTISKPQVKVEKQTKSVNPDTVKASKPAIKTQTNTKHVNAKKTVFSQGHSTKTSSVKTKKPASTAKPKKS